MVEPVVYTRAMYGLQAPLVRVETHISGGAPTFSVVGLVDTAVRESKERVRSALMNCGYHFPLERITVNLSPADLPKDGNGYDLAIALGILLASGQLRPVDLSAYEFSAELGLDGALRPVRGHLAAAVAAAQAKRTLFISPEKAGLAANCPAACVLPAAHLLNVVAHLSGDELIAPLEPATLTHNMAYGDIADVRGQPLAQRAMLLAAAGGHHCLLIGSPGTGKSLLASRLPGLLPPLSDAEAIELATIEALAGQSESSIALGRIPFRAPHHTSSAVAMIGGGRVPCPGEVSLAHHGILFLDELPEYARPLLEALREPLEQGHVHIARTAYRITLPACFQLIAAMNPCPCGYLLDKQRSCRCSAAAIERYHARLSGPLLDRLDMRLVVAQPSAQTILSPSSSDGPNSASYRAVVKSARALQRQRQRTLNARLPAKDLLKQVMLSAKSRACFEQYAQAQHLSARACHRLLRLIRTIADCATQAQCLPVHVEEACFLSSPCHDALFGGQ